MMAAADEMYGLWNTRIATGRLNRWLEGMLEAHRRRWSTDGACGSAT